VGVEFSYPVDTFEHVFTQPRLTNGEGHSTINAAPVPHDERLIYKRVFDIAFASVMLIVLSVPMVLIAVAVKVTSRGPILFAQQRYGKNRRLFVMYKFRSMRVDAESALLENPDLCAEYHANNFKLPDKRDPRITPLGRFLRRTSLDELPQLWNVVRGEMSIVGPRPILPAEISHYGAVASLLLALKPGLTSMWVVEGRSSVGYPRRAHLEIMYVRNWSLLRDLCIVAKTVPAVLRGTGAH
jgi:lipopolysaccharide/colanic/teichoic acid biosynthesis glycosyltransferase